LLLNKNKAYTLIELIVSIALVAIISISVIPRFLQTAQFQQQVFLQQLMHSLAYIQNLAIGTGCHISATNNVNTMTFNLRQNCISGAFSQSVFDPQNVNNALVITAPSNVTIVTVNFPIYFDNNGLAYSVSNGAIVNSSVSVNSQSFSITGNTGLIS